MTWDECQAWESAWWGDCRNTFGEEMKQLVYAKRMGLRTFHDGKSPFNFDMGGKSCVELGGGPASILLKFTNASKLVVVDPCEYPRWVYCRYLQAGIEVEKIPAEEFRGEGFDIAIIANCLQHVIDPALVIANARRAAKIVRVFEWIDTGTSDGHEHNLTEEFLNEHLGGEGKVEHINENYAVGKCFYGVFPT